MTQPEIEPWSPGSLANTLPMRPIYIRTEPPFPCDYTRNGYCKRVITLTAESKRVFYLFVCLFKSQTAH